MEVLGGVIPSLHIDGGELFELDYGKMLIKGMCETFWYREFLIPMGILSISILSTFTIPTIPILYQC